MSVSHRRGVRAGCWVSGSGALQGARFFPCLPAGGDELGRVSESDVGDGPGDSGETPRAGQKKSFFFSHLAGLLAWGA